MAIVRTDDKHYKAIADTLRSFSGQTDTYKPDELPNAIRQGINEAHVAGINVGKQEGYNDGYTYGEINGKAQGIEIGKNEAYDAFWDDFQQNGNRVEYQSAFGGQWTMNTWKPKYPMLPQKAYMMFFSNERDRLVIPDFVEFCKENGIILDFKNAEGSAMYALAGLHTNHHGVLDFSCSGDTTKTVTLDSLFYSHEYGIGIKVIDEFISSERTIFTNDTFQKATQLEELNMSGVIATNNFNVQWCTKLTHDSLMSIINALQDKTGDASGTKWVVTLGTENCEKLDASEIAIATQKGWTVI